IHFFDAVATGIVGIRIGFAGQNLVEGVVLLAALQPVAIGIVGRVEGFLTMNSSAQAIGIVIIIGVRVKLRRRIPLNISCGPQVFFQATHCNLKKRL
ncbi:hypothetical protein, partial [Microbulbifer aestuariivivens]|uniref:hypothetical protein n=1 Tax=Microbulbifer aestuariivivens TaxID=1908308 RepID=UPI0031E751D4